MSEDESQVVKVVNNREFIGKRIRDPQVSGAFMRPTEVTEPLVERAEEEIRNAARPPPSFTRRAQPAPPGGVVLPREAGRNSNSISNGTPEQKEKENLYIREQGKQPKQDLQVVKVVKNEVSLENFPISDIRALKDGPSDETLALIRGRLKQRYEASVIERGLVPGEGSQIGRVEGTLVSRSTMEQYLRRGTMLFERWRLITGSAPDNEEDADPVAWVNWLLSVKPSLKSSTWRMYRQSVLHWLEGFPGQNTTEAMRLLETDITEGSRPEEVERRRKASRGGITNVTSVDGEDEDDEDKTSALKEKRIPEEALEKIRMRLRIASRSKLAEPLVDWLEAGVLTGLRPVEWSAVDLVVRSVPESEAYPYGRMVLLYVINAKATNGRGTGVARTLDLSRFAEREFGVVRRHAARCRGWLESDKFTVVKGQCSTLLRSTVSALWPKGENGGIAEGRHYALYSCRHQAIANWKALDMPLEEIAAIVGHGVTSTTTERYGKRRSGWKPDKIPAPPRGIPEEVSMVRQRISMFHERIRQEKELGIKSSGPSDYTV